MYILHILFFKILDFKSKLQQVSLPTCHICKIYITFTSYKIANNKDPTAITKR